MKKYIISIVIVIVVITAAMFIFKSTPKSPDAGNIPPAAAPETGTGPVDSAGSAPTPAHQPQASRPTPLPPPVATPTKNQGRLVLAITDETANLADLDALFLHIKSLEIHAKAGWKTIPVATTRHDLLALDRAGAALAVLADLALEPGEYNQLRLIVEKIVVQKDGLLHEAKLPSGQIIFNGKIAIEKEKTSAVILDFLADQSLFIAGNGMYIFLPVVRFTSHSNLSNRQLFERRADLAGGGKLEHDITLGTTASGQTKPDFRLDPTTKLEFIGAEAIRVIGREDNTSDYAVSAQKAIETALNGRYIASARSVASGTKNGKPVWVVTGLKGGALSNAYASVYVDAATGQILSVE
ncbi:MAG: DUF4382 domain-containing protein [Patescibacteria group bacterium]|mgnify:CR=1 FL=1